MVAQDKGLAALEPSKRPLWVSRPEEQVSENKDPVGILDLGIPLRQHDLIHLLDRLKRPLAEPYDVEMPKMLIRAEVCHRVFFLSIPILLSHLKFPVCRNYNFNRTVHVGRIMVWGNRILRENKVQAILANVEVLG